VTQDRDVAASRDSAGPDPAGPDPAGRDSAGRDSAGDESLSDLFWSVARQLRETSQETLAPWDITPSHLRALRVLRRHGPMRLSGLSDHLHIAARSATEVVDGLEARALIQRRPDPADRRATLVELTEHGAGTLDAIRGAEAGQVFGRLSRQDRADLARILRRLRDLSARLIRAVHRPVIVVRPAVKR
jgi:DNA-binding MarR family transcriptional regulator